MKIIKLFLLFFLLIFLQLVFEMICIKLLIWGMNIKNPDSIYLITSFLFIVGIFITIPVLICNWEN